VISDRAQVVPVDGVEAASGSRLLHSTGQRWASHGLSAWSLPKTCQCYRTV